MDLKIKKLHKDAVIPKHMHDGDAGFDFSSYDYYSIHPYSYDKKVHRIPTGLAVEIPIGYEMNVRARSGLSLKYPSYIATTGGGTVDSTYRGEIIISIVNNTNKTWCIKKGDRIAQGIIHSVEQCEFKEVEELTETKRGIGGFGSTGIWEFQSLKD